MPNRAAATLYTTIENRAGAQGDQRLMGISTEIHHIADGRGHRAVDVGHDQYAQKVKQGAEPDSRPDPHAVRTNAGGDGVGGVGPAVDKDDAQRQRHSNQQNGIGG